MNEKLLAAAKVLLEICGACQKDENILFVTDNTSQAIADVMWEAAEDYPNKSISLMTDRIMHGDEPPKTVAAAMANADVIFGITKFSMFHTSARRNAVANGARFINMADYNLDMMENGGLQENFLERGEQLRKISSRIEGDTITIKSAAGTNLVCKITGKKAVPQYGRSLERGSSSSPPDIEWAIGPLEGCTNGVLVVDGSIPHPLLGIIETPITITIKDGYIVAITGGKDADVFREVMQELNDPYAYHVGEVGIGMNRKARLNGSMLEDEGCDGTMHIGIGSNIAFGGHIECNNHIDLICKYPTIKVDGRLIVDRGTVLVN